MQKIYSDIAYVAGHHFSMSAGGWLPGKEYTFDELTKPNNGTMSLPIG